MKGLRWKLFFTSIAVLTSAFITFATGSNVSAFNLGGVSSHRIDELTVNGNGGGNDFTVSSSVFNPPAYRSISVKIPNGNEAISTMGLKDIIFRYTLLDNYYKIPAGSLFPVQITYYTSSTSDEIHFGRESFPGKYLLNKSCFTNREVIYQNFEAVVETTCTYWLYTPTDVIYLQLLTDAEFPNGSYNVVAVGVNTYSLLILNEDGSDGGGSTALTEEQLNGEFRSFLQTMLGSLSTDQQTANSLLDQIRVILKGLNISNAQVQETMDDIKANQERQWQQDQQDRQDYQNATDDAETAANNAGADVSTASGSLIDIIYNFVDIIAHPPQSNCNINADMGHMDLGTVNLCQFSLPPALSVIASLLMIGVIIPVVISIITTLSNLIWRFFV